MNSRERINLALNHQEPNRIPLDTGGTGVSQIHATAYTNLYNDLPPSTVRQAHSLGERTPYC